MNSGIEAFLDKNEPPDTIISEVQKLLQATSEVRSSEGEASPIRRPMPYRLLEKVIISFKFSLIDSIINQNQRTEYHCIMISTIILMTNVTILTSTNIKANFLFVQMATVSRRHLLH